MLVIEHSTKSDDLMMMSLGSTDQRYDKGLLEPKGTGNGEHGVQTGEYGSKQDDFSNARANREIGQMISQGSKLFSHIQGILGGEGDKQRC